MACTIPGTDEEFTLKKYREGLGKSYSRITLFLAPVPEIEDIDVPDDSLIDTEPEMSENNNMDEILNEDMAFLSSNGYIASAPESSTTSNFDTEDYVMTYEVADFL